MGAQAQLAIAHAKKGEAKADKPALREERAMDEAAVVLHGQEQLARYHVALRGPPDVPAHGLAGSELIVPADEPDLDRRHGWRAC
jgi:hypothetical protein